MVVINLNEACCLANRQLLVLPGKQGIISAAWQTGNYYLLVLQLVVKQANTT